MTFSVSATFTRPGSPDPHSVEFPIFDESSFDMTEGQEESEDNVRVWNRLYPEVLKIESPVALPDVLGQETGSPTPIRCIMVDIFTRTNQIGDLISGIRRSNQSSFAINYSYKTTEVVYR